MDENVIIVTAAIIMDAEGKRVLIAQRPPGGRHPGAWEFPGGKVEPGETPEECLARELDEEMEVRSEIGPQLARVHYSYPDLTIDLLAFRADIVEGSPQNTHYSDHRWVLPEELKDYDMLPPDRIIESEIFER